MFLLFLHCHFGHMGEGVSLTDTTHGQRHPRDRDHLGQGPHWTETLPADRYPHGQYPLDTDPPLLPY